MTPPRARDCRHSRFLAGAVEESHFVGAVPAPATHVEFQILTLVHVLITRVARPAWKTRDVSDNTTWKTRDVSDNTAWKTRDVSDNTAWKTRDVSDITERDNTDTCLFNL